MALALQKIILANAGSNTPGAYYQAVNITATNTALGNTAIPAGVYVAFPSANIAIQATPDNGVTWTTVIAKNAGGWVISDGVNVRLSNDAAANANTTLTYLTVDGGQNATGTYNS